MMMADINYLLHASDEGWFSKLLAGMVALSYLLWVIALLRIIVKSQKLKTQGMPPLGTMSMMSICFVTGWIGPWADPCNFEKGSLLVMTWRLWTILLVPIYIQFLKYGGSEILAGRRLQPYFQPLAILGLVGAMVTQWTFIQFFRDYYINIACPLLCVLPMAAGYVKAAFTETNLKGMSITAALLLTVGTALLYLAVVLGNMHNAYPHYQVYGFIYWIYGVTIVLLYAYTILLVLRRNIFPTGSGPAGAGAPWSEAR
jgi:hypothetical protein